MFDTAFKIALPIVCIFIVVKFFWDHLKLEKENKRLKKELLELKENDGKSIESKEEDHDSVD